MRPPGLAPGTPGSETCSPGQLAVRVEWVANLLLVHVWWIWLSSIGSGYAERNPFGYAADSQQLLDSRPGIL